MYYLNENIKRLERIFDQNKREGYLRLDLNENPGGLPDEFIRSVLDTVTSQNISQYPETLEFMETLAGFLKTDINHICLVNGSSEGIRYIIEAYSRPGGEIVGVVPTYAMFEIYANMYGRKFVPVLYTDDLELPIERILKEMTLDVDLLILLNPNNPMGNVYTEQELEAILMRARKCEITVLIDEAYIYFYPNEFLRYALENEHVFVTRTFSKIFSLAGCRLGYVVGWPEGIRMVQKLCTPHNINFFGMRFAQAILQTDGMLDNLLKEQMAGKQYLINGLQSRGYTINAKEGNFIFVRPKTNAKVLADRLKKEKGILIKTYPQIGNMGECLRVTTGEKRYMEQFLAALQELDN